jgi:alpha-tubulin suppressor-like RCC1 family protein
VGGQLGDGRSADSAQPVAVAGGLRFTLLRMSGSSLASCGLTDSGEGWCWGPVADLWGNGATVGSSVPVRVDWGRSFVTLDLGELHGCGLTADGQAWCWGSNWYGQLGVGSAGGSGGLSRSSTPRAVVGGRVWRSIAAGSDHSCALDDTGAAWCWGVAFALGSPTSVPDYVGTPQRVAGGHLFTALKSGQLHTCGLTAQGEAWCWGQNYGGELGDGTHAPAQTPVRVQADVRFAALAHRATCALSVEAQAWCWGDNSYGQVGRTSHWAR